MSEPYQELENFSNTSQEYKDASVDHCLKRSKVIPGPSTMSYKEKNEKAKQMKEMELSRIDIDNYAQNALKQWEQKLKNDSELSQFSLFLQINHDETDIMANMEEIDDLLKIVNKMSAFKDKEKMEERAKEAFDKNQKDNHLTFKEFQQFLKDIQFNQTAEEIDHQVYMDCLKSYRCIYCFCRCCSNKCRAQRMKQNAGKLQKLKEIENGIVPSIQTDPLQLLIQGVLVVSSLNQVIKFFSDINLLILLYYSSFESTNKESGGDYQVAIVVFFVALASTVMSTQSVIIGMKFAQGDYEPQKFREINCISKIFHFFLLTFIGACFMVLLEILDNFSKVLSFLGILLKFIWLLIKPKKDSQQNENQHGASVKNEENNKVDCLEQNEIAFKSMKMKLTGLSAYQHQSIEDQRLVFALLFETLPIAILLSLISLKILDCKELVDGKNSYFIHLSLASAFFNVFSTIMTAYIESKWLKETTSSYLMTKITGNNKWIPFIHQIISRECKTNINFDDITIKIPFVTQILGFQKQILFEFGDNSLTYLLDELNIQSMEKRGQVIEQRYRLTFTEKCLKNVSLNTLVHFINNFPEELFVLDIYINWHTFYQYQKKNKLIKYTIEDGEKRCYSPKGEPLLLICIKNEKSPVKWHLKDLLKPLLEDGVYARYDAKNGSPLNVALQYKCFESYKTMMTGNYNFDIQKSDESGISSLYYLIQAFRTNEFARELSNDNKIEFYDYDDEDDEDEWDHYKKDKIKVNDNKNLLDKIKRKIHDASLNESNQKDKTLEQKNKIVRQATQIPMNNDLESLEEFKQVFEIYQNILLNTKIDFTCDQMVNPGRIKKPISVWQFIFKSIRRDQEVKPQILFLINKAYEQKSFDLNFKDQNTLFKNTFKIAPAQGKWKDKYFNLIKLCKLEIFKFKDNKGEGIEHKYISNPSLFDYYNERKLKIKNALADDEYGEEYDEQQDEYDQEQNEDQDNKEVQEYGKIYYEDYNKIDDYYKTLISDDDMFDEDQDMTAYIMSKMVQSGILMRLFDLNNDQIWKLLLIDSLSGVQIDDFNKDQKLSGKLHLLFRKEQYFKYDNELIYEIQKRSKRGFGASFDKHKDRAKNDQNKKNKNTQKVQKRQKEDYSKWQADGIFTKKKPQTSKYKRNVTFSDQVDPKVLELSLQQKQALGLLDSSNKESRRKKFGQAMRSLLEIVLEWIAAADLYTDVIVLLQLLKTDNRAWVTITIFSILAPFFACQTPLIMFLKERIQRESGKNTRLNLMGQIMVSPFMLIYMFILDIIFIFNQAILLPIIQLLKLITFGMQDLTWISTAIEKSYELFFGMQKMEAAGFRRMRTISQLTFETLIQIILQVRMFQFFQILKDKSSVEKFGVSLESIGISLLLSCAHALIEIIFLYMEAQASRTSFLNYSIICFNGRFGWVPYNDYLITKSQESLEDDKEKSQSEQKEETEKKDEEDIEKNQKTQKAKDEKNLEENEKRVQKRKNVITNKQIYLNYQQIQSQLLCLDIEVEFQFTDYLLISLTKTFATFPKRKQKNLMPIVKFGSTIDLVRLDNLINVIKICQERIIIDLAGTNLKQIILASQYAQLLTVKEANEFSKEDKNLLLSLQRDRIYQIFTFILEQNEQILNAKFEIKSRKQTMTLAEIALDEQNTELLNILMSFDYDTLHDQLGHITKGSSLATKFLDTLNFEIWTSFALNTTIFQSHELNYRTKIADLPQSQKINMDLIKRNLNLQWMHARFGPNIQNLPNHMKSLYFQNYPKTVYVHDGSSYIDVECTTAFMFVTIRKLLFHAWNIDGSGPFIDQQESYGTESRPLDISGFGIPLSSFKLLNMLMSELDNKKVENLTGFQVNDLDNYAKKLKLDTNKCVYIGRTRLGDETGHQIETLFMGKSIMKDDYEHAKLLGKMKAWKMRAGQKHKNKNIYSLDYRQRDRIRVDKFVDGLELTMPSEMSFITSHKMEYALDNIELCSFIQQYDHSLSGILLTFLEPQQLESSYNEWKDCENEYGDPITKESIRRDDYQEKRQSMLGDCQDIARLTKFQRDVILRRDQNDKINFQKSPYYQIESINPNSIVRYTLKEAIYSDGNSRIRTISEYPEISPFRVIMHIDFPYGIDIEEQQKLLEEQARMLNQIQEEDMQRKSNQGNQYEKQFESEQSEDDTPYWKRRY